MYTWTIYKVVSKIIRTGAAIYTVVVVAQSTSPNGPNCQIRVLLAASPWRLISHLRPHPVVSDETQNGCHPPLYSPDLGHCDFYLLPKMKLKLKGRRFGNVEEFQAEWQRVGPVSTYGKELCRGWGRPICLVMSFMIFTASVRNILGRFS
jgi:hypothetical protein